MHAIGDTLNHETFLLAKSSSHYLRKKKGGRNDNDHENISAQ